MVRAHGRRPHRNQDPSPTADTLLLVCGWRWDADVVELGRAPCVTSVTASCWCSLTRLWRPGQSVDDTDEKSLTEMLSKILDRAGVRQRSCKGIVGTSGCSFLCVLHSAFLNIKKRINSHNALSSSSGGRLSPSLASCTGQLEAAARSLTEDIRTVVSLRGEGS